MIDVLLASYNGERYISEQIESVLAQTCGDFTLHICDDCSTDRTAELVRHYTKRYPDKVKLTVNEKNSGSAGNNFFKLLNASSADYIMFCDQDDVWFKDKIERTLAKMRQAEINFGESTPILVHTDLTVADKDLKVIAPSMFKAQHLDTSRIAVNNLAVQNVVTGCTVMLNRTLADRLNYIPSAVPVHDWWIALLTACCGRIVCLDEPTLYYRKHDTNVCGAQDMESAGYIMSRAADGKRARLMMRYGYMQAAEMAAAYGDKLGRDNFELLKGYGELVNKGYFERLDFVVKNKMFKSGVVRKVGQVIYL